MAPAGGQKERCAHRRTAVFGKRGQRSRKHAVKIDQHRTFHSRRPLGRGRCTRGGDRFHTEKISERKIFFCVVGGHQRKFSRIPRRRKRKGRALLRERDPALQFRHRKIQRAAERAGRNIGLPRYQRTEKKDRARPDSTKEQKHGHRNGQRFCFHAHFPCPAFHGLCSPFPQKIPLWGEIRL